MIHHLNLFKTYNPVVFRIFTMWYNHQHHLVPEHFHFPQPETLSVLNVSVTPHSPSHQPLATMNPLPVSVDLPILDTPYKWNHTVVAFWVWLYPWYFKISRLAGM